MLRNFHEHQGSFSPYSHLGYWATSKSRRLAKRMAQTFLRRTTTVRKQSRRGVPLSRSHQHPRIQEPLDLPPPQPLCVAPHVGSLPPCQRHCLLGPWQLGIPGRCTTTLTSIPKDLVCSCGGRGVGCRRCLVVEGMFHTRPAMLSLHHLHKHLFQRLNLRRNVMALAFSFPSRVSRGPPDQFRFTISTSHYQQGKNELAIEAERSGSLVEHNEKHQVQRKIDYSGAGEKTDPEQISLV